jgi:hypothetical protein
MRRPAFVEIDGKRYLWGDLVALRREQLPMLVREISPVPAHAGGQGVRAVANGIRLGSKPTLTQHRQPIARAWRMTKERQKKRKRLRAASLRTAGPTQPLIVPTPKFYAIASLHRARLEHLYGVKPQYTRDESHEAFEQLVAEGAIDL